MVSVNEVPPAVAEAENRNRLRNGKTGCPTAKITGNGRKLGKNSPPPRKIAKFPVFLAVNGLLFFDERL